MEGVAAGGCLLQLDVLCHPLPLLDLRSSDHEGDVAAARAAVDLAFSDNDPDPVEVPGEPAMSDAGDFDSPTNDAAPPSDHKGDVAAASDAVGLAFPAIDPDPVEVPDEPGKSDAE